MLFPICGSLRDNQAQLKNGKTVNLPRHGFARKRIFQCDFARAEKAQFTLVSDSETVKMYPFQFSLSIRYEISGNVITTIYNVSNMGTEDMPFFIGGHPGFNCPMDDGCSYEDYIIEFEQEENCQIPTPVTETGLIDIESRRDLLKKTKVLPLSRELFERDALILDNLVSRKVKLRHKERKQGIELDFSGFPYLVLWSVKGGDFVEIEPWSGLSTCSDEGNQFEDKRNVMILKPDESKEYCYKITIGREGL